MRLSDAIALGRTLVTKCRAGGSTRYDAKPGEGCVLDMAVWAVKGSGDWKDTQFIWPWVLTPYTHDGRNYVDVIDAIYSKFDLDVMRRKTMTLDQLIDWVRSIEPAEVEQAVTTPEPASVQVKQ